MLIFIFLPEREKICTFKKSLWKDIQQTNNRGCPWRGELAGRGTRIESDFSLYCTFFCTLKFLYQMNVLSKKDK